jgi:hypothetical protein
MTDPNLYLLSHPEKWPHSGLLPLSHGNGNIIHCKRDAGIVMEGDLYCVWTGYSLGEIDPRNGMLERYKTPEELLTEWAID